MKIISKVAVSAIVNLVLSKKTLIGISFLLFIVPFAEAQDAVVTGKVVSADNRGLQYISVMVKNTDGRSVKGGLSDSAGLFKVAGLPAGKYQVQISGLGFVAHLTSPFSLKKGRHTLSLGDILMKEDAQSLNAVVVSARRSLIEHSIDKMTINVEGSILSEGNSALELLERSPGVKIDNEGKVSLNGRKGVNVMMNGKPTYLSASELAVLLKGTNSSSVARIELINNPPSKYDAAGNAGIINIVLKKDQRTGFNGALNANAGAGRNARYGSGISFNYRNGAWNFYGAYNYAYRGETEYLDFIRRFGGNGMQQTRISTQRTRTNEPLHTHNFRTGIDFDIDSMNVLGLLIIGNTGRYIHDSNTDNLLRDGQGILQTEMRTSNYDRQSWSSITYNLNYLHRFDSRGHHLSIDLDAAPNRFDSNLNLDTYTLPDLQFPNGLLSNRIGNIPSRTKIYTGKLDYAWLANKTLKFESGLKASFIRSDNDLRYYELYNDAWNYDPSASNHFIYDEKIYAAYGGMNKEWGATTVQGGIRAEYTITEGRQITSGGTFDRDYLKLFPNLALIRRLNERNKVQLTYGRRIERPNYGSLNPFRVFRDPTLFYEGNPYLLPEITQNVSLSHHLQGKFTSNLSYSRTTDVITWVTGQDDQNNTSFESPKNLPLLQNIGLNFTAQTELFSWWSANCFAGIYQNTYTLENSRNRQLSYNFNTQNAFKIVAGVNAEVNAFFNSKSAYGILKEGSYWALSAAVSRSLWKEQGSLKLAVNDIFQTNNFRNYTRYQNIDMYSRIWIDSRRAVLSFSYRFGKQTAVRDRTTSSQDIQGRLAK